ncbi:hypothetical protein CCR85_00440 [Rhodothalassium salexigens]|uniref:accessory factor UbiK family protein n=1 Tax=Rhodothalassium salexigens TaxID=1086 RepID=UPI0019125F13|nr:accessory factor UbiK family protein [Rhodothalassium salexigens]MBK5909961.1 hypothetical protein [Rhodothalassium salexigens]MBK5921631.1 hypothetical protein [Rhodothalassium salexigens]
MQNQSKLFDDFAKLAQGALGAASSAREEFEATMRAWVDSQVDKMNLVPREDFDVVAEMAQRARTENDALAERVAALEAKVDALEGGAKGAAAKPKSTGTKSGGTSKAGDTGATKDSGKA